MTIDQITGLISLGDFPEKSDTVELIETHISWVILCDRFVYKIKKPVKYSFLDFSSIELRRFFCYRELELNRRLTHHVYLEVLPVQEKSGRILIGNEDGTVMDYALKMHKLKTEKRMDKLLVKGAVRVDDIKKLAEIVAAFHKNTTVIYQKNLQDLREEFNDLSKEREYLAAETGSAFGHFVEEAIVLSDSFLNGNKELMTYRLKNGMYRDGHGDLHSRNIFLLPQPVPFDCIEFNDDFRQIDVLNEIAFLCMDLDAFGFPDLSEQFLKNYNYLFPAMATEGDKQLFIYYKIYRANVRAKVNSLRARSATTAEEKNIALAASEKYLNLMKDYMESLRIK